MSDELLNVSGGCYCGTVRYQASGVSPEITECHCSQCRRQAGHRYASTGTKADNIAIDGADNITWFRASDDAERGFCRTCGSHLFWKQSKEDFVAILAASFDDTGGMRMAKHIFVDDKGAYYDITDGLPQFEGYDRPLGEAS